MREEQIKNEIAEKYFADFDTTKIIGNIDFAVATKNKNIENDFLFWAEAKKGNANIENSITQLVLTIGKAQKRNNDFSTKYIGCFDERKITFVEYHHVNEFFSKHGFNWNVRPSDYNTQEFKMVLEKVRNAIEKEKYIYDFATQEAELKFFIKNNFNKNERTHKRQIDKNNFTHAYYKWLACVKPTIQVPNWEKIKKHNILDSDFYLADLLSEGNVSIDFSKKLRILLESDKYKVVTGKNVLGTFSYTDVGFADNQKAHNEFWNKYERPPREEYWGHIIERRDLLVPQDFRERKGSFFTPTIWVEKSQETIAEVLGEHWQEEYYVWDCACGTGNLLAGLTEKYKIFASDIELSNISALHTLIESGKRANLLEKHCFRFDFLQDSFDKLPKTLKTILKNEPHKLLIYINPPYAESGNKNKISGGGKKNLQKTYVHNTYFENLGIAGRQLFAQFLIRIYKEIPNCKIANFSTLSILAGNGFKEFRAVFTPKLKSLFLMPSYTFDNVPGKFPIGFFIWDGKEEIFTKIITDVYNEKAENIGTKNIHSYDNEIPISHWIQISESENAIGYLTGSSYNSFQHNDLIRVFTNIKSAHSNPAGRHINAGNLLKIAIHFAIRKCIPHTWQNHDDRFLYPNEKWKDDAEFQNDCLAYTLFHTSNNIKSEFGTNHWIPFYEKDVNAKEKFESNMMADFIGGKIENTQKQNTFKGMEKECFIPKEKLMFSKEAKAVFEAGKELWKYYHSKSDANVNASLYDIRGYFQGFKTLANGKKRMHAKSKDEHYTMLLNNLKTKLQLLGDKIAPKIYEYGFLLK